MHSFYSFNQYSEKEVLLFCKKSSNPSLPKQQRIWTYFRRFLEQIEDVDIEDNGHQLANSNDFYSNEEVLIRKHKEEECTTKGIHDGKKKRDSLYQHQEAGKQEKNQMGLLTMDDGIINWGEHTEAEETNHALMAISSSNEKTVDSWKDSSKNLWRLINSGMSSNDKVGLGFEIQSNDEVLSYEEEMNSSVFKCLKDDSIGKPSYSRFTKTNGLKKPEISVSDDNSSENSTCQSNDSEGSCGNTSKHSFETESESVSEPSEMSKSSMEVTNEKDVSAPKSNEVEPSSQMAHSNAVMGNWGSAVKTSASYNWRNTRPNFHYNSGPTLIEL
ncbi:hypothetical protein Tco_0409634 [Tanacetum coccineum]